MKERVKELAEFHSLNINLMQAIYEDIRFSKKEWVELTDEERIQVAIDSGCLGADWIKVVKATEAKLKEKNGV
jgi:hypothetical protein